MSFKVQVGPAQVAIHQGRTVLVCEPDGGIAPGEKGLYLNDTRLISNWSLTADGVPWDLLSGGAVRHDTLSIHLANRALVTASGPITARTLGLVLDRPGAAAVAARPHPARTARGPAQLRHPLPTHKQRDGIQGAARRRRRGREAATGHLGSVTGGVHGPERDAPPYQASPARARRQETRLALVNRPATFGLLALGPRSGCPASGGW